MRSEYLFSDTHEDQITNNLWNVIPELYMLRQVYVHKLKHLLQIQHNYDE